MMEKKNATYYKLQHGLENMHRLSANERPIAIPLLKCNRSLQINNVEQSTAVLQ